MPQEWTALYIDDEEEFREDSITSLDQKEIIPDHILRIETADTFRSGISIIQKRRFDFVIIDVNLGDGPDEDEAGIQILNEIQSQMFVPIIFYTGFAYKVADLENDLVKVVRKGEGFDQVLQMIQDIFRTNLPVVNKALIKHMDDIQRHYMWDFVSQNWDSFSDTQDKLEIAFLLARRLATTLNKQKINDLAESLGGAAIPKLDLDKVHPIEYYIVPPIPGTNRTGDIITKKVGDEDEYYVILNPTCDFVNSKVDWMLICRCCLLSEQPECIGYIENPEDPKREEVLISLMRDNRQRKQSDRFFFLPGAFHIPNLLVDLQQLEIIKSATFLTEMQGENISLIATLDNPFAETLSTQYSRYIGRIGKPNLNTDIVITKLKTEYGL
jgi:ActR/RegA family two-component response regulator